MVEGPLTSMVPASALQMHPRATILLDQLSASALSMAAYFREVHKHKPDWQKERDGV